jgi:hypothetical protein
MTGAYIFTTIIKKTINGTKPSCPPVSSAAPVSAASPMPPWRTALAPVTNTPTPASIAIASRISSRKAFSSAAKRSPSILQVLMTFMPSIYSCTRPDAASFAAACFFETPP